MRLEVVAAVLWTSSAQANDLFLRSKEVVVEGLADIAGEKVADARSAAIASAQRQAVEQALGALIESKFSAEQRETLKGEKHEFLSNVSDKVKTESAGFIEGYRVLSEERKGATYRVKLKVTIKSAPLEQELEELNALFKAVGYPKVLVLAAERYTDEKGKSEWIDRPTITALLEEALIARGFSMVDREREATPAEITGAIGDAMMAAGVAKQFGGEVAIVGTAEVKKTAFDEMGDRMHYVSATVNFRAVSVSKGTVMTSFETLGKGVGASPELARVKAVRAAAPAVIDNLLSRLVEQWKAETEGGTRFLVSLEKVKSYGKDARPFMKAMKTLPNVKAVKELGFGRDKLELEVIFVGTKEALLDAIFEGVAKEPDFAKLDKVSDRGDRIDLTL